MFLAETDFELESVSDDEEDDLDYLDDLERNGSESNLSVKRSLSDSGAKGLPAGGSSRTLREVSSVLVRLCKIFHKIKLFLFSEWKTSKMVLQTLSKEPEK
jgi:hypothetical protein